MIRLLCAGLGGMGHADWSAAAAVKEFKIVGGADVQEQARKTFEEKTGAPTFDNFYEALRKVKADAALVATPDAFHAPYTIAALKAGLDVICEKPMAESMADARRMHETAKKRGRMLMVHQQLRWANGNTELKRLVDKGTIGTISHMEFDMYVFSDVCIQGYRSRLPQLMLQDLAIHHFDLMRFLTGQECVRIDCRSWKLKQEAADIKATTNVYALLDMSKGARICYRSKIRSLLDDTGYGARVEITGSRGSVSLSPDGKVRLQTFKNRGKPPREIIPKGPRLGTWESFAKAIRTRKPTLTESGGNLKSLAIVFAAIRSVETGSIVELGGKA